MLYKSSLKPHFFFFLYLASERSLGAASMAVGMNARQGDCSPGEGMPTCVGIIILRWKLSLRSCACSSLCMDEAPEHFTRHPASST